MAEKVKNVMTYLERPSVLTSKYTDSLVTYLPVLHIIRLVIPANLPAYSVGIFTDQTVNKHADFHSPVASYIEVNRDVKQHQERVMPSGEIHYHTLDSKEQDAISILITDLDQQLSNIVIPVTGLLLDDKPISGSEQYTRFSPLKIIRSTTNNKGCRIDYQRSYFPQQTIELEEIVNKICVYLKELCLSSPNENFNNEND